MPEPCAGLGQRTSQVSDIEFTSAGQRPLIIIIVFVIIVIAIGIVIFVIVLSSSSALILSSSSSTPYYGLKDASAQIREAFSVEITCEFVEFLPSKIIRLSGIDEEKFQILFRQQL